MPLRLLHRLLVQLRPHLLHLVLVVLLQAEDLVELRAEDLLLLGGVLLQDLGVGHGLLLLLLDQPVPQVLPLRGLRVARGKGVRDLPLLVLGGRHEPRRALLRDALVLARLLLGQRAREPRLEAPARPRTWGRSEAAASFAAVTLLDGGRCATARGPLLLQRAGPHAGQLSLNFVEVRLVVVVVHTVAYVHKSRRLRDGERAKRPPHGHGPGPPRWCVQRRLPDRPPQTLEPK